MKKLLIIFSVFLFSSCASYQINSVTMDYNFNQYDYNNIHSIYVNNPHYFYNTTYIDQYGIRCYYYMHPYFIRYCTYRNISPNYNNYINHRTRRTTLRQVPRRTNVGITPVRRTRVSVPRTIRQTPTTRRQVNRTRTTSSVNRRR
jgi:hypothetical protein